ncbi:hypothetical protein FRB96_007176 [Tulasnella sp. 330]|nr:hypothetical protein FRB96_007176 [Tulasnella sp. 330]
MVLPMTPSPRRQQHGMGKASTLTPPPVNDIENPFAVATPHDDLVNEIIGHGRPSTTATSSSHDSSLVIIDHPITIPLPSIYVIAPDDFDPEGFPQYTMCIFSADEPPSPRTPDMKQLQGVLADLERLTDKTPTFRRPRWRSMDDLGITLPLKKINASRETLVSLGYRKRGESGIAQVSSSPSKRVANAIKGILKAPRYVSQSGQSRVDSGATPKPKPIINRPTSGILQEAAVVYESDTSSYVEIAASSSSSIEGLGARLDTSKGVSKLLKKGRSAFLTSRINKGSRQSATTLPLSESTTKVDSIEIYHYPARATSSISLLLKRTKRQKERATFHGALIHEIPPLSTRQRTDDPTSTESSAGPSSGGSTPPLPILLPAATISTPVLLQRTQTGTSRARDTKQLPPLPSRPFSFFDFRSAKASPPLSRSSHTSPPQCQTSPRSFLSRFSLQHHSPPHPELPLSSWNEGLKDSSLRRGSWMNKAATQRLPTLDSFHFSDLVVEMPSL